MGEIVSTTTKRGMIPANFFWLVGWLDCWVMGIGWLVGWLNGLQVGWLVGWLVSRMNSFNENSIGLEQTPKCLYANLKKEMNSGLLFLTFFNTTSLWAIFNIFSNFSTNNAMVLIKKRQYLSVRTIWYGSLQKSGSGQIKPKLDCIEGTCWAFYAHIILVHITVMC